MPNHVSQFRSSRLQIRALALFVFLSFSPLMGCNTSISDANLTRVAVPDVLTRVQRDDGKSLLLIDTRPLEVYEAAHLPGAIRMGLAQVSSTTRDPRLSRFRTLVVYAQNPGSATAVAVAKRLLTAGYDNVQLFDGGVDAWKAAGLPTEKGRITLRADTAGR